MADILLENITKSYTTRKVLDDVCLAVKAGDFVAVLGPSGCGKTTLLRLIAGFEKLDSGLIRLGDVPVSSSRFNVPPEKRNIGIVFQNYALWPHMSVMENVGYALKIAGVGKAEWTRRSLEALAVVGMEGLGERAPSDLSGGQRQRVALARCLAANPTVMLLDEPLANLDVHLRASMENEFVAFHRRTGASMIYITHDQAEAMALADRIAVMDAGRIVQFAPPRELYREPRNEMVARFIGNGLILPADDVDPSLRPGHAMVEIFGTYHEVRASTDQQRTSQARVCVHPAGLKLVRNERAGFAATVERVIYRGSHNQIDFHADAMPQVSLTLHAPDSEPLSPGAAIAVRIDDGWVIPAAA
ncbi:ABC transporter ATP-binding protein [Chelatococcus asaccharovorans]|uniref:Iron(III) transport system ATP-binding protein n=1 Tax=Chelatococcus asaccharovorans TaxID=28210 RepID=A0A2V3TZ37_9HYPH|nr:ABC transporter ATP-binding protein [Chelatococcus asaccharovorans]MBS7707588.1 ABC transporter ATP-binding protein [Chelatococcus asaccharovorans]PXW55162.1 iron(III) transport system ATP-binding protein [Chelatococcus asaccharovorans]